MKTQTRIKITAEVFTPNSLVEEMLDKLPIESNKTYLDNSCGNGQFLIALLNRGIPLGWPSDRNFEEYRTKKSDVINVVKKGILFYTSGQVDSTSIKGGIFGVDLMFDNCMDTIARLQLFEKEKIDYWDEKAVPLPILAHPGHSDDHSWDYLKKHKGPHLRTYKGISVRFSHFNNGGVGVFEYSFDETEWTKCYNVVCCDALLYNYEFDNLIKV